MIKSAILIILKKSIHSAHASGLIVTMHAFVLDMVYVYKIVF